MLQLFKLTLKTIATGAAIYAGLFLAWHIALMIAIAFTRETAALIALAFVGAIVVQRALMRKHWSAKRGSNSPNLIWPIGLAFVCCIAVALLCFLDSGQGAATMVAPKSLGRAGTTALVYLAPIYWGWIEELVFRGYVQRKLEVQGTTIYGIVVSTSLFVSLHLLDPGFGDMWPFYVMLSLVCASIASVYGRLVGAVAVHVLVNLAGAAFAANLIQPLQHQLLQTYQIAVIVLACAAFIGLLGIAMKDWIKRDLPASDSHKSRAAVR